MSQVCNYWGLDLNKDKSKKGPNVQSYIKGLITGVFITLTVVILSANKKKSKEELSKTYRQKILEIEDRIGMLEGSVNERFKLTGENFIHLKNKFSISVNSEFTYRSQKLRQHPFPYKQNKWIPKDVPIEFCILVRRKVIASFL